MVGCLTSKELGLERNSKGTNFGKLPRVTDVPFRGTVLSGP